MGLTLELIYYDLCEMNGVLTKGGKRYFMTLIDDSTRYCYVYMLSTKDEALHYFRIYKAEVENQLEKKIKRVRSDHGHYNKRVMQGRLIVRLETLNFIST